MLTFEIERDDERLLSRRNRHPDAFRSPHRRAREGGVDEVVQGETLSDGLFPCGVYFGQQQVAPLLALRTHGGDDLNRLPV